MIHELNDSVTIVIPVLNEEKAIGRVIKKVKEEGFYNILVVDGFSSDDTISKASQNHVDVILQKGKGKTGAIATAINKVQTRYLVVLDGDCTYDPKDIENVVTPLRDVDLVIGVRALGRNHIPFFNRLGNRVINSTFNLLMGTRITDICSGMYGIKTDFARSLKFQTSGFDVEVEIVAQTTIFGRLTQVPIRYHERVGSQKLQPVKDGLNILYRIFFMAMKYRLSIDPFKWNIAPLHDNEPANHII